MAIVKMTKIKLIALADERENILNALHRTGCVQIKQADEIEALSLDVAPALPEQVRDRYVRLKSGVEFITETISHSGKGENIDKAEGLKNFFCSYGEFSAISEFGKRAEEILSDIDNIKSNISSYRAQRTKLNNLKNQLLPYSTMEEKFSDFVFDSKVKISLGLIKAEAIDRLRERLSEIELCGFKVLADGNFSVICAIYLFECAEQVNQILGEYGFNKCPFDYQMTAAQKIKEIDEEISSLHLEEKNQIKKIYSFSQYLKKLKILCDYYKFELEKAECSEKFAHTSSTFLLEGYLPEERVSDVKDALKNVTDAVMTEFSEPTEEDNPPTLLKNNKVVRQSEFIIDLYSPPAYKEADPSKITFFFFMLFMGVIMADVGYGILMIGLGLVLAHRIKVDCGARRLWYVIAIGGIFTIAFGVLFNSFFGFAMPFYTAILPSPVPDGSGTDSLMTIMLLCLGLGVFQIAVGYLYKAINCFKEGDIIGGIFDGLIWVLFFIGFVFAAFNFLIGYLMPDALNYMNQNVKGFFDAMMMPGLIMVGGALVTAMLTAGRKEKGFGHFTKGFGALYGIINIMSDILSYARLFGLMLSGMIIAQTFNDMGISILTGGGVGYLLGPVILVVGHAFNLAMGVLGAYIHDSRLQYIEFFGKFYAGEGEKFTPLGSKLDYVYLTK